MLTTVIFQETYQVVWNVRFYVDVDLVEECFFKYPWYMR